LSNSQGEDNTHSCRSKHRTKSLLIVNAWLLTITLSDKAHFIPFDDPLFDPVSVYIPTDNQQYWNSEHVVLERPCAISHKRTILFGHGLMPLRMFVSNGEGGMFGIKGGRLCMKRGCIVGTGLVGP
jgi:hypothetical protein